MSLANAPITAFLCSLRLAFFHAKRKFPKMGLDLNGVNHNYKNATNSCSQMGDDLVIDLGRVDTKKFLMQGVEKPTKYVNKLSAWEMDSLTALGDTFLPAMEPPNTIDESIAYFYRVSPSMIGTPNYVRTFYIVYFIFKNFSTMFSTIHKTDLVLWL